MQELKTKKQWILWKYEDTGGKKLSKIPYQATMEKAKVNDSNTFDTYNNVYNTLNQYYEFFDGIGFVFTEDDEYVGIDLDEGIDKYILNDIINTLDSYTEESPSGKGYHIIVKGKKKNISQCRKEHIEIYDKARYFTITQNIYQGKDKINYRQKELDIICQKYLSKNTNNTHTNITDNTNSLEDIKVIELASKVKNSDKFNKLFNGDITGYPSQSEADIALCQILAFYTNKDSEQIERIYKMSALYRDKWDVVHNGVDTYGQMTIQKAIDSCNNIYTPNYKHSTQNCVQNLDIVYLDTVKPIEVEWLLYPYLPLGKVVVIAGEQGIGKSFFTLYLVSKFSKGISSYNSNDLFFGVDIKPQKILYQNAEDGIEDTIAPRLIKLNANMSNIAYIKDNINFNDSRLEQAFKEIRPTIAVFDPVQSFIDAKVDTHKVNEVRQTLNNLIELGSKYNCTIILIMHNNKMTTQKTLYRVTGSVDFTALPRSVLSAVQDPQDPNNLLIIHSKSNLARKGQTLKFTKLDNTIEFAGYSNITDYSIDNPSVTGKQSPKLQQAIEFLQDYLQDGEKTKKDIEKEMYNRGLDIGKDTLIKAGSILDIIIEKQKGFGTGTIWKFKE